MKESRIELDDKAENERGKSDPPRPGATSSKTVEEIEESDDVPQESEDRSPSFPAPDGEIDRPGDHPPDKDAGPM